MNDVCETKKNFDDLKNSNKSELIFVKLWKFQWKWNGKWNNFYETLKEKSWWFESCDKSERIFMKLLKVSMKARNLQSSNKSETFFVKEK
jgi:hypothetical protein